MCLESAVKTISTTPTPHISQTCAPKIWHKMRGCMAYKNRWSKGTFTENMVYGPTFMAYELRLLWHTNPDFYVTWVVFIGVGWSSRYWWRLIQVDTICFQHIQNPSFWSWLSQVGTLFWMPFPQTLPSQSAPELHIHESVDVRKGPKPPKRENWSKKPKVAPGGGGLGAKKIRQR